MQHRFPGVPVLRTAQASIGAGLPHHQKGAVRACTPPALGQSIAQERGHPPRARAPVRQLFAGPSTSATACSRRRAPYRSLGNVRWWMGFCDVDLSSAQSWSPREVAEIPMRQQEQVPASHGHRTRSGCSTPQAVALRAWLFSMESRSVVSVGGHCSFTWRSRWPLWSGGRLPTRPKRYDALAGNELARPRRALLLA